MSELDSPNVDRDAPTPAPAPAPPAVTMQPSWWDHFKPKPGYCANCGEPDVAEFCPHCGQRHADERLTLRNLASELPSRYISLDRGFLRTIIDMSTRPGQVCFDYVSGKRRKYANPFAYFLVAATVQLISLTILRSKFLVHMRAQLEAQATDGEHPLDKIFGMLGEDGLGQFAEMNLDLTRSAYSYLWIFFAIVFAFTVWLLPFMGKRRFNLPEVAVYAIYSFAHILIVLGLLGPLGIAIAGFGGWVWIVWASYYLYLTWSAVGFFKGGVGTFVGTAIGLGVSFVAYLIVFTILLFTWLGIKLFQAGVL